MNHATRTVIPRVETVVKTVVQIEVAAMTEMIAVDATVTKASAATKETNGGTTAENTTLVVVDWPMSNDTLAHTKITETDSTAETGEIAGVDSTTQMDNMTTETEDLTVGTDNPTVGTDNPTVGTDALTVKTDALTTEIENRTTGTVERTAGIDIRQPDLTTEIEG